MLRSKTDKSSDYSDYSVDSSIFHNRKLTFSQALVLFLKEEKKLRYSEIAQLLKRDPRTVQTQYTTAIRKLEGKSYRFPETQTALPVSRLCVKDLSLMEAAVLYLKNKGMANKEIAEAIGRNTKTISSMIVRIRKRGDLK